MELKNKNSLKEKYFALEIQLNFNGGEIWHKDQ